MGEKIFFGSDGGGGTVCSGGDNLASALGPCVTCAKNTGFSCLTAFVGLDITPSIQGYKRGEALIVGFVANGDEHAVHGEQSDVSAGVASDGK